MSQNLCNKEKGLHINVRHRLTFLYYSNMRPKLSINANRFCKFITCSILGWLDWDTSELNLVCICKWNDLILTLQFYMSSEIFIFSTVLSKRFPCWCISAFLFLSWILLPVGCPPFWVLQEAHLNLGLIHKLKVITC